MPGHAPGSEMDAAVEAAPIVFVVDDEEHMGTALRRLFVSAGLATEVYATGEAFLARPGLDVPGCVVLDVGMPGMGGLEVQARLHERAPDLPVIFLTGAAEVHVAVTAMRAGAADFVEKPFDNEDLLRRVQAAIARQAALREAALRRREFARRLATLTPREGEVLEWIVAGKTSKEIARALGGSHRTIEIHRGRIMEKTAAASLADLIRMRLLVGAPAPARRDGGADT
ncbi:response regulator transcription factor [Dokdonella fugitiva]|uniref:FixJ family two-component response regulator n=1 Tax=Dokdonella fugitiva TaxID=328517 RepID=A0A4R2I018_9GAMM|nr:response regulator [Dokdonella fugitiva]TCO37192.1 FixJ family two-component response regulator [Dokdonella fugitiva]